MKRGFIQPKNGWKPKLRTFLKMLLLLPCSGSYSTTSQARMQSKSRSQWLHLSLYLSNLELVPTVKAPSPWPSMSLLHFKRILQNPLKKVYPLKNVQSSRFWPGKLYISTSFFRLEEHSYSCIEHFKALLMNQLLWNKLFFLGKSFSQIKKLGLILILILLCNIFLETLLLLSSRKYGLQNQTKIFIKCVLSYLSFWNTNTN